MNNHGYTEITKVIVRDKMDKKPKLGTGKRFAAMENHVEKEGYSPESAKKIAASIGIKAHGKKNMAQMASKARKKK